MFSGQKVFIIGAGISGLGAAKAIIKQGGSVTVYDKKQVALRKEDKAFFSGQNIHFISGNLESKFIKQYDFAVISPGISINSAMPQSFIAQGLEVISEIELAWRIYKGKIIAVTGTNGKTTTTTLVSEMVAKLPIPSATGGNIGQPLSWLGSNLSEQSLLVAEISSFQLEGIKGFKPHIAAVLNITPDHIDRHGDLAGYVKAKEEIFRNQTNRDYLILNFDDKTVCGFAPKSKAQVCFFSAAEQLEQGAFVRDGAIVFKWQGVEQQIIKISAMKIFGGHNVENALAACACAYFAGVSFADMKSILSEFEGVEHRIEYTRTINGVKYYNDSKATNPESSIKALQAFPGHVILLAGGYDKLTDLKDFMQLIKEKTDALILLGKAKERFAAEAQSLGVANIIVADSFEAAVQKAYEIAKEPQVVVLSPACSSYDMFNNFEERGRYFKELVNKLS